METSQIALLNETYIAVLQMNGLFFIGNIILLWMMFRGVTTVSYTHLRAHETG